MFLHEKIKFTVTKRSGVVFFVRGTVSGGRGHVDHKAWVPDLIRRHLV